MSQIPWLTLLILVPLVFAVIALSLRDSKSIKGVAMVGTLVTFVLSLLVWAAYGAPMSSDSGMGLAITHAYVHGGSKYAITEFAPWIPSLNVNYLLGLDGISLMMVLMTALIWPFVVGVSFKGITERENQFYFWVLMLEAAVMGVFLSLDLVLFYVFWEAMLIPLYFIVGIWGGPRRIYATVKFFLYTMVGSMIMLVSIIGLYFVGGSTSFDLPVLLQTVPKALAINHSREMLLFFGFFLAFGIKAPIWPFHTWVPDAYSQAPTGGTIALVALKMGLYGFIRFCLPLFPHAVQESAPIIIILSVIGVVWAAWVAAMQTDLKRLLAYSSISHVGVIMLAIFALNNIGIAGAVVQMVSHTVTMGALFILVGGLYERRKSYAIADFGGLTKVMPAFTAVFLTALLSSVALPTTAGFTGEFLMLLGAFQSYPVAAGIATTAAIWSVVYMLWMFQRVMYGKLDKPENAVLPDWAPSEKMALVPLMAAIFFIGLFPTPILGPVNKSVGDVLASMSGAVQDDGESAVPATVTPPAFTRVALAQVSAKGVQQ